MIEQCVAKMSWRPGEKLQIEAWQCKAFSLVYTLKEEGSWEEYSLGMEGHVWGGSEI